MNRTTSEIAISGFAGTGTTSLGEKLRDALGWSFYENGPIFRHHAKKMGIDIKRTSEFPDELHYKVDSEMLAHLQDDESSIVEGWLAVYLAWAHVPDVYKIILTCEDAVRYGRIARRQGMDYEEAVVQTTIREEENARTFGRLYHVQDYLNHRFADLIVDTTRLDQDMVAHVVLQQLGVLQ